MQELFMSLLSIFTDKLEAAIPQDQRGGAEVIGKAMAEGAGAIAVTAAITPEIGNKALAALEGVSIPKLVETESLSKASFEGAQRSGAGIGTPS
jgi:hypothetical protein